MTLLALALRLAVAGGRGRTVLVAVGCAVGTLVLLVAFAVPGTRAQPLTVDDQQLVRVVLVALGVPVVALLAAVARLSAGVRDRRLAALRTLGVTATGTRLVAGLEATMHAVVGVAGGAVLFLIVRPVLQDWDDGHRRWFEGRPLAPGFAGWAAATAGVVAVCLLVAVLPSRQVTRDPLSVRRQASATRPRWWRVMPLVVGVAVLVWPIVRARPSTYAAIPDDAVGTFLLGAALTGLGLPLAAPVLVRLAGDLLVSSGRPVLLLAGRRLQQEPAAGTRLVATLLAAVFVVVGARCVVGAFENTSEVRTAHRAAVTGPQYLEVGPSGDRILSRAKLAAAERAVRGVSGVRDVSRFARADVACSRTAPRLGSTDLGSCNSFVVSSCAGLSSLGLTASDCRDDRPQWVLGRDTPVSEVPKASWLTTYSSDGSEPAIDGRAPMGRDVGVVRLRDDDTTTPAGSSYLTLVVPPTWPGLRPLTATLQTRLAVSADAGSALVGRVDEAARRTGFEVDSQESTSEWDEVVGYRDLVFAVGAGLFTLALLALLVTGVDAARARRRQTASLAQLGVPHRVGTLAQIWQTGVPAAIGAGLAGAAGLLAGTAYLSIDGARSVTPWGDAIVLTVGAAVGGVVVASVVGIGVSRPRPADLRRE